MSKTKQCRDLEALNPVVADKAAQALKECNEAGLNIAVTETLRTPERQDYLYAQGRTRPGKIITHATGKAMDSYHMWGLALDIHHNVQGNLYPTDIINKAAAIFKKHGFEWGGDWSGFKDRPHLQMTFGLTIRDLKSGRKPPSTNKTKINIVERSSGKIIEVVECDTIKKDGTNYIKLRDLSGKCLSVGYDGEIQLYIN